MIPTWLLTLAAGCGWLDAPVPAAGELTLVHSAHIQGEIEPCG